MAIKTFRGNVAVARHAGKGYAYLAYPGRAYEQSVLV